MTITYRGTGSPTAATAAVTAVNPTVVGTAVAGDMSILVVIAKPYSTTITTPSGWTSIGESTDGTVATGTDVGSVKVALFYRLSAPTGAIGNIAQSGANSMGAGIYTYTKTGIGWDMSASTFGADSTYGANFSATGATGINAASGDVVFVGVALNADVGTPSSGTIAGMSGATLSGSAVRSSNAFTTGDDMWFFVQQISVSAGSSTAAPTWACTNASSSSGVVGFLRLRELQPDPLVYSQAVRRSNNW